MSYPELKLEIGKHQFELPVMENVKVSQFEAETLAHKLSDIVDSQLSQPTDYPELMASIIDDDQIAIGLEDGVPEGPAVAAEVVGYLVKHGVAPERITLVIGSTHRARLDQVQSELQKRSIPDIRLLLHDASDHDSHAYVAASKSGDPIYVQRELIDADVSIPIYCIRDASLPHSSDPFGIAPTFTDAETQSRWNTAWIDDSTTDRHEHEALGREVGWLAGVHFAIGVVPTATGKLGTLIAGQPESIHKLGSKIIDRIRETDSSLSDLVIAVVEGNALQQNWLSIARAVSAAEHYCTPAGRILVCCDVEHLTRGIKDLQSDDPVEQANRRLLKSRVEDSFAAAVLRLASYRRSVYLYSSLVEEEVENLGLAFVRSVEDIQHLMEQAKAVRIVRGAQF